MSRDALDYGLPVSIPNNVVRNVTLDAPGGLGGSSSEGELNISPTRTTLDKPFTLSFDIEDNGSLLASWQVPFDEGTAGSAVPLSGARPDRMVGGPTEARFRRNMSSTTRSTSPPPPYSLPRSYRSSAGSTHTGHHITSWSVGLRVWTSGPTYRKLSRSRLQFGLSKRSRTYKSTPARSSRCRSKSLKKRRRRSWMQKPS